MGVFAVIVTSREMRSGVAGNPVVTKEGDRFWAVKDHWGPSSVNCPDPTKVPTDVMTFTTHSTATSFARRWKGHPWWCSPKEFEIVEVRPRYRQVLDGYERI